MAGYTELMSAIVKKQVSIIGKERALVIAKKVQGVTYDDDGNVVAGANKDALTLLCREYMAVAQGAARLLMKWAVAPLLPQVSVELPPELK
jgi:hypothetical protein